MGTFVEESAYIERLQEDIEIACRRLSEQGLESLVVTVGKNSHRVSGSQKGRTFLENKYTFIAEFVHYCGDERPTVKSEKETITLFNEQGKSVQLQNKIVFDNEVFTFETLNTPAPPDNDASNLGNEDNNDDTDDYDETQFFNTDVLCDLPDGKEEIKHTLENQQIENEGKRHQNQNEIKTEKISIKEEKETVTPLRRSLRNVNKNQSNNIVENLPRVKVVLSKIKDRKDSKQKNKWSSKNTGVNSVSVASPKNTPNKSGNSRKLSTNSKPASSSYTHLLNSKSSGSQEPVENSVAVGTKESKKIELTCRICKEVTESVELLTAHMDSHKALACHMCKKVFRTKENLQAHKEAHIDKNEYNECKQCDKVFKFIWQLGEHIEKVHERPIDIEEGDFPCNICGHVFKRELQLIEHNERNPDCAVEESEVTTKQNTNALLSEIYFTDPNSGMAMKRTVGDMLSTATLPATCEVCLKTFDKMYNFKRHVLHHSEVKPHKCIICSQQFQLEENHKKHVRLHDLRLYHCKNCGRRFETKTRLDHHFRFTCKKSESKPDLICDECGHQSQNAQSLEAHKRVHSGIKAWSCDVCGKLLSSRDSITRHKLVFHQDERPFECEQCGRRFKIKDTLKKHQKTHGERKFKCEVCGKACVESGNLKKHMMTHTKEKPFICETCGKAYGRRSLLENHRRLHTGEKPYRCDLKGCDKTFRSYGNLKQHKATHALGHAFICDICGKTFKVKSRMNHHRKNHTIDWRWPCDYCEQKFKSIFMYKNHLAKSHPEMKKDIESRTNIRLYQCDICQKMYGDKEDLTRHIYIHKGLKPFKCQYCGKTFNDKSNMKCHERIHTGEKKISCPMCYKTFIQPRALKLHMKNVHGQKMDIDEEVKLEESVVTDASKTEDYIEDECKAAVENVLQDNPPELTELRTTSGAVIAQAYPTHSISETAQIFPHLIKDFEPLMIVEDY